MLRILSAVLALFLVLTPATAQEVQPQNTEIETVIASQLDAFQADDVDQAFTYAAPNIRQIFRTPENFGTMVQRGYPMVWRPGEVTYLELAEIGGALWQRVEIIDREGVRHHLGYQMTEGENGWKISAVMILDVPDIAV